MAQITLSNLAHTYAPSGEQESDFALKTLNHVSVSYTHLTLPTKA